MDNFWLTLVSIALSTFSGAAAAFVLENLTRRSEAKRVEEAALDDLILEIAGRRALTQTSREEIPSVDPYDEHGDFARASRSVMSIRSEMKLARSKLRTRSSALQPLLAMTKACNHYLEFVDRRPERYWIELDDLRIKLGAEVAALHHDNPRLSSDAPGSAAF